jgi:hypothetical protein
MSFGSGTWLEGSRAARAGLGPDACPYKPISYSFVVWFNGWSWTKHVMEQEKVSDL